MKPVVSNYQNFFSVFLLSVILGLIPLSGVIGQNQIKISGKVTDESGLSLPGVYVILHGPQDKKVMSFTNADGDYEIPVTQVSENYQLVFRLLGYKEYSVKIERYELQSSPVRNARLELSNESLQEVVVIGYGKQTRNKMTTAISKLDNKVMENNSFSNAASALQGTISGVRTQAVSGQPGAAPRIIIRGGTSINNPDGANPLYIIDGVIRQNLDDIESRDIESMQVLKDAASTAIYGARGSNGVVIVTTKQGRSGKVSVNFSTAFQMSQVGKTYDVANGEEFIRMSRLGLKRAGEYNPAVLSNLTRSFGYGTGNDLTNNTAFSTQYLTPQNEHKLKEGWKSMPDPLDPSKTIIYEDNDWQNLLFRNAVGSNHYLSVNGGNEKAVFSSSLGYYKDQGIAITSDYDRLTFSLSGQIQVSKKLKFNASGFYSRAGNSEIPNMANTFYRSAGITPTAKYSFEDGTLAPGTRKNLGNPVYHLNTEVRQNAKEKTSLALGAVWSVTGHLTFSPQISYYKEAGDGYTFQPSYWDGVTSFVTSRAMSAYYNKHEQFQADGVFAYNRRFGSKHNVDATAGFSYYSRNLYTMNAAGQGASTDLIPTLNAASTPTLVGSTISDHIIAGLFYQVNYDYDSKYLLSVSGRYDGASNLGKDYKWGIFPGVSVGWNIHKEEFWQANNLLSTAKLRASYGVNGNISNLTDFHALGSYNVSERYLGSSAIQRGNLPNSALKWERSKTINLGIDLGFGSNRVNLLVDIYKRRTDDLLTSMELPPSTGFSSIFTNLGSLENKGVDIELNASVLPDYLAFKWLFSLNTSYTDHKILALPDNGTANNRIGGVYVWDDKLQDYTWKGGLQEGGRIGDHYAWKMIGVYSTTEEANKGAKDMSLLYNNQQPRAGDAIWQDVDKNGIIDERDRIYLGNTTPKWSGGFSNTFSYRNFSLYTRMDYITGHTIYNYARLFLNMAGAANINIMKEVALKSWMMEGDKATLPAYQLGDGNKNYSRGDLATSTNSIFYEKGNFLALRELSLNYIIKPVWLKKANIHQIKLRLSGNNLHYFTKYTGLSPEDGNRDNGRYPVPRSYTLGLDFSF